MENTNKTEILQQIKGNETILNKIGNMELNKPTSKGFLNLLDKFKTKNQEVKTIKKLDFNTFINSSSTRDKHSLYDTIYSNLKLNEPIELMEFLNSCEFEAQDTLFLENKLSSCKSLKEFQTWFKAYLTKCNSTKKDFKVSYVSLDKEVFICKIENINKVKSDIIESVKNE